MKYKVKDRVRIKSLDWYNENKGNADETNSVWCENGSAWFFHHMSQHCGKIMTIKNVWANSYTLGGSDSRWTDEMIEGLVEEGKSLDEAGLETDFEYEGLAYSLPEGYIFKDQDGNVINATKIVLEKESDDKLKLESAKKVREYWSEYARIYIEIYDDEPLECVLTHLYTLESHRQKGYARKALTEAELIAKELGCHTAYLKVETDSWIHQWYLRMGYKWYKTADKGYIWLVKNLTGMEKKKKEYLKTYAECSDILSVYTDPEIDGYKGELLWTFQKLLVCRDAYWKIAGEEMGLGKPWKPNDSSGYCIYAIIRHMGHIRKSRPYADSELLEFPTKEMRDAFYENFKELIEICKELL